MELFDCNYYQAGYLSEFNATHIVIKGKLQIDKVIKLRDILESLAESLKMEKLVLDFTECDRAFIDYNSSSRIAFWKNMRKLGLKMLQLIIPPDNFTEKAFTSWESFYNKNKLSI